MEGVNEVTLIGNLGGDPEKAKVNWPLLKFNLGVTESRPSGQGKWKEKTQWFRIVLKGNRVDYFLKNLKKGDTVYVKGRLSVRSWEDRNGDRRWVYEVEVGSKLLIMRKGKGHDHEQRYDDRSPPSESVGEPSLDDAEQSEFIDGDSLEEGSPNEYDDDLPF